MKPPIRPTDRSSCARVLVAAVAFLAIVFVGAPGAAAHSEEGLLTVNSVAPPPGATASTQAVSVTLLYLGDRHPAENAVVTISGTSPSGTVMTPVVMSYAGDGTYTSEMSTGEAGTWNLRVVSENPAAETNLEPVTVAAADLRSTSAEDTDSVQTGELGGNTTGAPPNPSDRGGEAAEFPGSVPPAAVWIVLAAMGVAAVAGGIGWTRRSHANS